MPTAADRRAAVTERRVAGEAGNYHRRRLLRFALAEEEDQMVEQPLPDGGDLLRRVIASFPEAKDLVPTLRMVVVAGPRIDPASLPTHDGLEVCTYVHELYRHLAACDLAVAADGVVWATSDTRLLGLGGHQGMQLFDPGKPIDDPPCRQHAAVLVQQAQVMVALAPVHPNKQHDGLLCSDSLVSQRRTCGALMAVLTWHDIPPAVRPPQHQPGPRCQGEQRHRARSEQERRRDAKN
jgi:hypothetical protein